MNYVYKFQKNEEVLYIGKSNAGGFRRIRQYGKKGDNIDPKAWEEISQADIYYIETANSTMSDVLESELINRLKPKYNKAKTSEWKGLGFDIPQWTPYRINDFIPKKPRNTVELELGEKIKDEQQLYIEELISENRVLSTHLHKYSNKTLVCAGQRDGSIKYYLWDGECYEEMTEDPDYVNITKHIF